MGGLECRLECQKYIYFFQIPDPDPGRGDAGGDATTGGLLALLLLLSMVSAGLQAGAAI